MNEQERIEAAADEINAILEKYDVTYAWDGFEDLDVWIEVNEHEKPKLRIV